MIGSPDVSAHRYSCIEERVEELVAAQTNSRFREIEALLLLTGNLLVKSYRVAD
jgi:hypothetical protein